MCRWIVKLLLWQDNLLLRFEVTVVVECLEIDAFEWWEGEGFVSEVEVALVEGHEGGRGEKTRLDVIKDFRHRRQRHSVQ